MEVRSLDRRFVYNGVKLPDPNPKLSPDEVKAFYSGQYPELATASITGPEPASSTLCYTFARAIGTKG
ncbi:MAG: PRTRC system protein C [Candidatus Acidiferrales bacterium]